MAVKSTYLQRPYIPRPRYGAYAQESPFARSFQQGSQIGGSLGTLADAIIKARDQQHLDAVANQLMNTQNAPRAALVSSGTAQYDPVSDMIQQEGLGDQFQTQTPGQRNVIPQGVSTTGTAPITGGYAEYQLRQKFQQDQLANQLQQAKVADYLAQVHGTGRYASKPAGAGGPSANQLAIAARQAQNQAIKQAYADQKANSDSVAKVYGDFDKIHGKGSAAEVYTAIQAGTGYRGKIVHDPNGQQHWVGDAEGPLFTLDPRAAQNGPVDKDFTYYPMDELNSYYGRLQNIQQKGKGGVYTPPLAAQPVNPLQGTPEAPLPTEPPTEEEATADTGIDTELESETPQASTDTSSTGNIAQNLPQPTSQDEYDALPNGSHFLDGDGMIKRKYAA